MPSETSTGNEWSGAVAQADLVQYQPGAVVSRTLVKKPTGTVTAFAFDAGDGLSEHTAPFDALVLMVDGEAEITILLWWWSSRKASMIHKEVLELLQRKT